MARAEGGDRREEIFDATSGVELPEVAEPERVRVERERFMKGLTPRQFPSHRDVAPSRQPGHRPAERSLSQTRDAHGLVRGQDLAARQQRERLEPNRQRGAPTQAEVPPRRHERNPAEPEQSRKPVPILHDRVRKEDVHDVDVRISQRGVGAPETPARPPVVDHAVNVHPPFGA